jgi:hypothetical protein
VSFADAIAQDEGERAERRALSAEEEAEADALIRGPPGKVIIDKFKIKITSDLLRCLRPDTWLNDEVRGACHIQPLPPLFALRFLLPSLPVHADGHECMRAGDQLLHGYASRARSHRAVQWRPRVPLFQLLLLH